jgi:glycosyltransferase involved in cell wall biosynthesis
MKIFIVNGSAQFHGGAERVALSSAAALAKRGHSVTVLAANGPVPEDLVGVENLTVRVANAGEPAPIKNVVDRIKFLWPQAVGRLLHEAFSSAEKQDTIVHFHSGYLEFGIPGFRQLSASKLPIVYTHHDYAWACPLMGFYDYKTRDFCPLVGGSLACLGTNCVRSYPDKLIRFTRHVGTHRTSGIRHRVSEHLFVSHTSYEKLAPYLDPAVRHTVLANPADFVQKPPVEIEAESKFCWIGRMTHEKDPAMLAGAAAEVQAPVRFIGDGPMADEVRMAYPAAEITGWRNSGEVQQLLCDARALVMTSRWLEAAPLVLAEAFSRGLPAVVPSRTCAAEFVDHGKNGFIYESSNRESLKAMLEQLMDDETAKRLGREAYRRFWADPPNWEKHLNGLEEVYVRALSLRVA